MRLAGILTICAVLCACGCLTQRGKVACRRAEIVLTDRGTNGDALAAACGVEMGQVNADTGADTIPPESVALTPEAATANASAIQAAREVRKGAWEAVKGLVSKAAESWPPLAGVVGALGLAAGLFAKLRKYKQTLETVVDGVGVIGDAKTKAKVRDFAVDAGLQPFLDKIVQRVDPPKDA